jgi:Haemolymph juvenile hormone binding protein (JHBP)
MVTEIFFVGVPSLNFPSMDPMSSEPLNLTVNAGSDQFKMNFLEPKFTGISTAKVSHLK